jgi:hypothetical protein
MFSGFHKGIKEQITITGMANASGRDDNQGQNEFWKGSYGDARQVDSKRCLCGRNHKHGSLR